MVGAGDQAVIGAEIRQASKFFIEPTSRFALKPHYLGDGLAILIGSRLRRSFDVDWKPHSCLVGKA